jgi:uncharacterized protein
MRPGLRGRTWLIAIAAAILVLLVGGRAAAVFVTELFWYRSLGLEEVFWIRWRAGLLLRLSVALVAGAVVFANLWWVTRTLGTIRIRRRYGNLEIAERLPTGYIAAAVGAVALLSAWWISAGAGNPLDVLAFLRSERWGISEPIFGNDLSFYVFGLPLLVRAQVLLGALLFWTALLVTASYVATGGIRWVDDRPQISPIARRHLGLIGAALLGVLAWDLWLGRYDLVISGTGVGGAPGYTDVHARIPGRTALTVLALAAAASVGWGTWRGSLRLPLVGMGVFVVGAVLATAVIPGIVQRYIVEPDQVARETPFIEANIRLTRLAFGLDRLEERGYPLDPRASPSPDRVAEVLRGVPLWDPRPLRQTYRAQQTFRPFYEFASVHVDRYATGAGAEPIAISIRELLPQRLPPESQNWQNLHLNYVRGEGVVASPTSRISATGEPLYYLQDIFPMVRSPQAPPELRLERPEIYFGELTREYVIIPPDAEGAELPRGVTLDALWKRLAYAWAFDSKNILLSPQVVPGSEIVYRRRIRERVQAVAPFLLFTEEGGGGLHPILHEGRVVWMLDGYTGSRSFPLSRAQGSGAGVSRYLRNSVKATVDAVSGETRFYMVDEEDPIIRTYARIFPGLIRPMTEMPGGLQRHLRFPLELSMLQGQILREFHVGDARTFFRREDVWDIPTELYRNEAVAYRPFYALLPVPGLEEASEWVTVLPFVAAGRQNLRGILYTRNDPPHYGEQILFEFPTGILIPGPQQIESMIDQNPAISEQLALWKRAGSDVIRGHMILVPIDGALLYVEPVFLEAQADAIPQLERVIMARGRDVVMRPTAASAAAALLDAQLETVRLGEAEEARERAVADASLPPVEAAPTGPGPGRLAADEARRILDRAEERLRAGDWAGFGRALEELREALDRGTADGQRP